MKNADLVVKYFPMALKIARRFRAGDVDVLEGAAVDGLIAAALRYDRTLHENEAFMMFARRRIEGAVQDVHRSAVGKQKLPRSFVSINEDDGESYEMLGLGFEIDAGRAMAELTQREQVIIDRLYFGGCTQAETAKELGVSFGRISQLNRQAIARIRKSWGL